MHCPNINSPEWKTLITKVSVPTAYELWDKYEGNVPEEAIENNADVLDTSATKEAASRLDSTLRTILAQLGITYEAVDSIIGDKNEVTSAVAKADLINKVLQVVEGRADRTTLSEETCHFLVEMLDKNGHVYKAMYDAITKFPIYNTVVREYSNRLDYTEDSLRKEAMAKLIAKELVNLEGESTLTQGQQRILNNWWNMLLRKVRQIFTSFDKEKFNQAIEEFSPFREIARQIANKDLNQFNQEIAPTHSYYQLTSAPNEVQQKIINNILATAKGIIKEGEGEDRGYFKSGQKLGKSVTTRRDEKFEKKFKNNIRTAEQEANFKESGRIGTLVHDDMDNISKRILVRDPGIAKVVKTNPAIYAKLEVFAEQLLKLHGEDAVYLSEQIVYDPSTNTPGTVDLIVIDKEGKVHIYDWKTMSISKREKEDYGEPSYYKTQKYEYQLNGYKDILEKAGVTDFGKRRYIPIETQFKKDKTTGQTYFAGVNIGTPTGTRDTTKTYLNPVPVSDEKTGKEAIDKLVGQLLALQKELRLKKAISPAEEAKKNQRIVSLNRAIRDLQLNNNLGLFVETANIQFKGIEARLGDTKTPLLEEELVDMHEQLKIYTNLSQKFARLYRDNHIPAEHITKLDQVSGTASRLDSILEDHLADFYKAAAKEAGYSDDAIKLYKEKGAKPVGLYGKLTTALSRIDHPIFKTFWNVVNKSKVKAQSDTKILEEKVAEKLKALKEWGAANGVKGTDIFNIMLDKKSGKLISKYKEEYYKTKEKKIEEGNWQWVKDNSSIDEAGLKKYIADQENFIKKHVFSSDDSYNKVIRETKLKELNANFNIYSNNKAYLNNSSFMRKFVKPSNAWVSTGFANLQANKPAFEFYQLFTSTVKDINQFMPLGKGETWVNTERFIPNLRADLIEQTLNSGGAGGISGLGQGFADMYDFKYDDEMRLGQINEFTGEYERTVPVYYTKEIDPKEKSYDLGRVLLLFGSKAYNYKHMSAVEGTVRNLRNVLADSNEALVDGNGKVIKNLLKSNKIVEANTLDTFDQFVNYYVYGVKEADDLGYFTKEKKVINPKTGEEELVEVKYSKNKIAKSVLRGFATKALGLNLISGGAQLFGNNMNSIILAFGGAHFNMSNWANAKAIVTSGNFNPEVYQFLEVLDIRGDNKIFQRADKLSVNNTARQANLEKAFFLYEYGDNALFKTVSVAMIQSHGIDANGKIKKLSQLPEGTKSIKEQLILDKDGKSNITTLVNEEEFRKFRNKIQALGEKITGMSSRDNMSGWRLSMAGQSLMQFRGWIPRTVGARFGAAKYDAELETVEKGRFLSLWNQIANKRIIPMAAELLRGALTGQFGTNTQNMVDTLYNEFMEENPHLSREDVTKEMFYEMHVTNTRASLMELSLYITMMILLGGLKDGWDDDDDDKRFKTQTMKTLNRFSDEIGFYLNPNSFQGITRGAVPAVGLFTDIGRFFGDIFGEAKGMLIEDEAAIHNNKPLWAFARGFVPGGNTMWNWFGDKTKMKETE